jgi:hypothetical protein
MNVPGCLSPENHKALVTHLWKLGVFLFFVALAFLTEADTREVVQAALSDAYIQVSSFVALTLAIFYGLEHVFKLDTDTWLRKYKKLHIPIAALMGGLPGCGGAIIVMTQYVSGRLGFSSVVAVLCSTMGDAAFLLLAREPQTAIMIFGISLTCGIVFGYLVELVHGEDFLREQRETKQEFMSHVDTESYPTILKFFWAFLIVPGIALGFGNAFQVDTDLWFGTLEVYGVSEKIGLIGALLCTLLWALSTNAGPSIVNLSGKMTETKGWKIHFERVLIDTNFVTVWVIFAYLVFELTMLWTDLDLQGVFATWGVFVPLLAVLIGFIPGCGPQVLVTTLYLAGLIPLSAQMANAISNDGDALFPALAIAPKAAFLATIYTAIPALIVGYAFYFMGL